jgi:hypothetical protein
MALTIRIQRSNFQVGWYVCVAPRRGCAIVWRHDCGSIHEARTWAQEQIARLNALAALRAE